MFWKRKTMAKTTLNWWRNLQHKQNYKYTQELSLCVTNTNMLTFAGWRKSTWETSNKESGWCTQKLNFSTKPVNVAFRLGDLAPLLVGRGVRRCMRERVWVCVGAHGLKTVTANGRYPSGHSITIIHESHTGQGSTITLSGYRSFATERELLLLSAGEGPRRRTDALPPLHSPPSFYKEALICQPRRGTIGAFFTRAMQFNNGLWA